MAERLIYQDTDKSVYAEGDGEDRTERVEWADGDDRRLAAAVSTLRDWAAQADGHTVTQGNAVATLQQVVDNLAVFYARFADLLEREYRTGN